MNALPDRPLESRAAFSLIPISGEAQQSKRKEMSGDWDDGINRLQICTRLKRLQIQSILAIVAFLTRSTLELSDL
jgi:hypothetical protein